MLKEDEVEVKSVASKTRLSENNNNRSDKPVAKNGKGPKRLSRPSRLSAETNSRLNSNSVGSSGARNSRVTVRNASSVGNGNASSNSKTASNVNSAGNNRDNANSKLRNNGAIQSVRIKTDKA